MRSASTRPIVRRRAIKGTKKKERGSTTIDDVPRAHEENIVGNVRSRADVREPKIRSASSSLAHARSGTTDLPRAASAETTRC